MHVKGAAYYINFVDIDTSTLKQIFMPGILLISEVGFVVELYLTNNY